MTSTSISNLAHTSAEPRPVALVDLLDRLLGTGIVLAGDITISLADVELVHIRLHALIMSVRSDPAGPRR